MTRIAPLHHLYNHSQDNTQTHANTVTPTPTLKISHYLINHHRHKRYCTTCTTTVLWVLRLECLPCTGHEAKGTDMQLAEFDSDSKTHKWATMDTSDETIHRLRSPGSNKHAKKSTTKNHLHSLKALWSMSDTGGLRKKQKKQPSMNQKHLTLTQSLQKC